MVKPNYGDILKKKRLKFINNKELEKYYENKYKKGGYKKGFTLHGINLSKTYHKERQDSAFKHLNPKKRDIILDAGCGNGVLTIRIAKKCKKIYGIDISKNAFAKARKKAPKNLIFKKMDIEHLKFKDKFFNKIVCVETLEHVLHPKKVLREFSRVIKSNGILVLSYPTINKTTISKIQSKLKINKPLSVSEHLTEWDYATLIKRIEKKGFKFINSEGIVFDFGKITKIKQISRFMTKKITDLQLMIRIFPKNSLFVNLTFRKK